MKNLMNSTTTTRYCLNHLKHSGYYMHLLEPCNASLNSLMTKTEMVVKHWCIQAISYLIQLLARESLSEQFNVVP